MAIILIQGLNSRRGKFFYPPHSLTIGEGVRTVSAAARRQPSPDLRVNLRGLHTSPCNELEIFPLTRSVFIF